MWSGDLSVKKRVKVFWFPHLYATQKREEKKVRIYVLKQQILCLFPALRNCLLPSPNCAHECCPIRRLINTPLTTSSYNFLLTIFNHKGIHNIRVAKGVISCFSSCWILMIVSLTSLLSYSIFLLSTWISFSSSCAFLITFSRSHWTTLVCLLRKKKNFWWTNICREERWLSVVTDAFNAKTTICFSITTNFLRVPGNTNNNKHFRFQFTTDSTCHFFFYFFLQIQQLLHCASTISKFIFLNHSLQCFIFFVRYCPTKKKPNETSSSSSYKQLNIRSTLFYHIIVINIHHHTYYLTYVPHLFLHVTLNKKLENVYKFKFDFAFLLAESWWLFHSPLCWVTQSFCWVLEYLSLPLAHFW